MVTRLKTAASVEHTHDDAGNARKRRRCGQALLFILMAVTILAFVVLWNIDLHRIVTLKTQTQHAGDAAALSAARWQAISLNLVGELNLMAALALSVQDTAAQTAISAVQARLCFTGPMAGLIAAQVAAKNNGAYADTGFSDRLRDHARRVRTLYHAPVGHGMLFEEPFPGAWLDYAAMLDAAAAHGIAAAPDNARFYSDRTGPHILLDSGFYEAVASQNWCWFFLHAPGLIEEYTDYRWWPFLPDPEPPATENSEIFPLDLVADSRRLRHIISEPALHAAAANRGIDFRGFVYSNAAEVVSVWYRYHATAWGPWTRIHSTGETAFPITGPVKPRFDTAGADAAVRVRFAADPITSDAEAASSTMLTWTAAAKPFGSIDDALPATAYNLVLPVFRDVRLIPVDASSAPAAGAFDIEWRRHIEEHLDDYLLFGPRHHGCGYCDQLVRWEDPLFRQQGIQWLRLFSDRCVLRPPGVGGRGGGTRRGH